MVGREAFKIKTLSTLLGSLIAMTISTYIYRYPTGDDAWFAEQSYWLYKQGVIRSEYFRGIVQWENQILVSHKLFLAFGSLLIRFFGYSLPTLQFTGLLFFLVIIFQLSFYVYKVNRANTYYYVLLILILVFSNRLLIKMSFENRPEMMVSSLGFGSFLLINFYKENGLLIFLGGLFAGLSLVCHLNGCIYVITGVLSMYYCRYHYKYVVQFIVASAVSSSLYLIDILSTENGITIWLYQLRNDPATQASFNLYKKIIQLVTYPRVFLQSPEQLSITLVFAYILVTRRNALNSISKFLRVYLLILIITFGLISKGNAGMYEVLFIPLMLVFIYELYVLDPVIQKPFSLILSLYFIIGIYGSVQIVLKNYKFKYIPRSYAMLDGKMPKNVRGVVPLTFFFNEYEKYSSLLTIENYKLYCHKENMTANGFGVWAHDNEVSFILIDYKFNSEKFFPAVSLDTISNFKRSYFDGRFAIYENDTKYNMR